MTGTLDQEDSTANFLGRKLIRRGDSIILRGTDDYFKIDYEWLRLQHCNPSSTPGTSKLKRIQDGDEPLSREDHRRYRQAVGRLQWVVPIRPDIAFSVKELARSLTSPNQEDLSKLKHLLRYIRGTENYQFIIRPNIQLSGSDCTLDLDVYCDSDWAGCSRTRKSTTGFIVFFLGTPVQFASRTQAVHALSSGEAELYAIGSATAEALHVRSFLLEAGFCRKLLISIRTDAKPGKSMAVRYGCSKKTRHVELRFLYIQHLVHQNLIRVKRVPGHFNTSDPFTKYVDQATLHRHLTGMGLQPTVESYGLFQS